MNTTPQAALLSDDELDALRQQAGGALNFVTLREFRAIAKAVTPAILAKLQATQEPVQAGELPDEREAFELFAQNCPMGKYSIVRRDGGYDSSHTQIMWDAWQARAAIAARKPLTDEQRAEVFRAAENRMVHALNLSWRNAVVEEVERAHGIGLEVKP